MHSTPNTVSVRLMKSTRIRFVALLVILVVAVATVVAARTLRGQVILSRYVFVIDDADAGFTPGSFSAVTDMPSAFRATLHTSTVASQATFTFRNVSPGTYRIYTTWPSQGGGDPAVTIVTRAPDGNGGFTQSIGTLNQTSPPKASLTAGLVSWQLYSTVQVAIAGDVLVFFVRSATANASVPTYADAVMIASVDDGASSSRSSIISSVTTSIRSSASSLRSSSQSSIVSRSSSVSVIPKRERRIIDDADGASGAFSPGTFFSIRGKGYRSTYRQAYSPTYSRSSTSNGTATTMTSVATYRFNGMAAGAYDVYLTWPVGGTKDMYVDARWPAYGPYTLYSGLYKLNQSTLPQGVSYDGAQWQRVMTVKPTQDGTITVTIRPPGIAKGLTLADAVMLVPVNASSAPSSVPIVSSMSSSTSVSSSSLSAVSSSTRSIPADGFRPTDVILDDADASFFGDAKNNFKKIDGGGFRGSYYAIDRSAITPNYSPAVGWAATIPGGSYDVYATWPSVPNPAVQVGYQAYFAQSSSSYRIGGVAYQWMTPDRASMTIDGVPWYKLGTFPLPPSPPSRLLFAIEGYASVFPGEKGIVAADAILLRPLVPIDASSSSSSSSVSSASARRCGDGIVSTPEQCDNGSMNGQPCMAPAGSSCTYCNASCIRVYVEDFRSSPSSSRASSASSASKASSVTLGSVVVDGCAVNVSYTKIFNPVWV